MSTVFSKLGKLFSIFQNSREEERKLDLTTTLHASIALLPIRKKGNPRKSPVCSMAASIVLFTQLEKQKHLENSSQVTDEIVPWNLSFYLDHSKLSICTDFFFSLFKYFSIQWFVEESYEKYSNVYLKIPFLELNKGCCPMKFIYENISNNKAYFFNPLLYKTKTHGNQWSYCALHNI